MSAASPKGNSPAEDRVALLERAPLVTLLVVALVIAGAVALIQLVPFGDQDAGNLINGIIAGVTALNVLLTFYLLRTAQHQLRILRDDQERQEVRHTKALDAQQEQYESNARDKQRELDNVRDQLENQARQLELSRLDAQRAHAETAKMRLDANGPRCSVELTQAKAFLRRRGSDGGDPELLHGERRVVGEEVDQLFVEVLLELTVTNWGAEPVVCSTGSPLEPSGSFVVKPEGEEFFRTGFRDSVRRWWEVAEGVRDVAGRPPADPGFTGGGFEFLLPICSLDYSVIDMHRLRVSLTPVVKEEFGALVRDGAFIMTYTQKVAVVEREYRNLAALSPTAESGS